MFLETLAKIGDSIERDKFKKQLHQEKIGNDFVLSFDESKRMLAICASSKVLIVSMHELLTSLNSP